MLFQICPECDMQQDISPYDVCQVCGHEWTSEEIRSSTPVPIERGFQQNAHLTPESLASSQAVSNTSALEQLDGDTPPAQAQVA